MRQLKENKRKVNPTTTTTKNGKKGKRFIERRSDVMHTLKMMSINQRDPLVTDDNVPQTVLQHIQQAIYLQHLKGNINWDEPDLEVYTSRQPNPQVV
ncbi:hypothetical protein Pcinc_008956 [Petrolisthes cinctipes]|uniref:Uncharacterized protein n=1 Tax=Petrolisthes cinctipes TaxID=88211 RepID=A0AAE1G5K2_PETCI|nr:hypothetical protein Pcinc_008956 [Petrolisthes cinctipes]